MKPPPSFDDGAHCPGRWQNRRGGFWRAGSAGYSVPPRLKFARRNFEQMKDYGLNACFIDVLTAALFDCYSPTHHSKWGDMHNKRAMMELADQTFGIFTEHGFSGARIMQYSGYHQRPSTSEDFSAASEIPFLFAAVYHDAVAIHAPAEPFMDRPLRFLRNLRSRRLLL